MEAFFTSLLLTALVQTGDRSQLLCAALGERFDRTTPLAIAVILASAVNAGIAALGGIVLGDWISQDALRLFYALSLLFAGAGMLAWRRPVDVLAGWTIGPFFTPLIGLLIVQFGDKGQFIVAATAARSHDLVWPLLGGWAGGVLGLMPAVIWRADLAHWPVRPARIAGGIVLTLLGTGLALAAFGLI